MFKPSSNFITDRSKAVLFCIFVLLFVLCVYLSDTVLSVPCSLAVTCWERADLLTILYVMFSCGHFVSVLGQVWYLIVSFSDFCLLPYLMICVLTYKLC